MRDAQTSGGYPKIATIIAADLWRIGQTGSAANYVSSKPHIRMRSPRRTRCPPIWTSLEQTFAASGSF